MSLKAAIASNDARFRRRVQLAAIKASIAILNESAATSGHATRAAYAVRVLAADVSLEAWTLGVLTNPTILAAVTASGDTDSVMDSDIDFQVNSQFNAFAGWDGTSAFPPP